jgi:predicted phage tail protein
MLRQIVLHGKLKELYQDEIRMDVFSVAEAIRGLSQIPKFRETLEEGAYKVCLGKPDDDSSIPEEVVTFGLGKTEIIHIIPVLAGSKGGGGKIILGVAMLALAWYTAPISAGMLGGTGSVDLTGGAAGADFLGGGVGAFGYSVSSSTLAKLGLALVLGGINSVISPQLKNNTGASSQNNFLFSGPQNTDAQGLPVPLVYGRCLVGSVVISSGISTMNITPPAIDPVPPPSIG